MVARRTRRMSSSLLPLNITPATTSIQPPDVWNVPFTRRSLVVARPAGVAHALRAVAPLALLVVQRAAEARAPLVARVAEAAAATPRAGAATAARAGVAPALARAAESALAARLEPALTARLEAPFARLEPTL